MYQKPPLGSKKVKKKSQKLFANPSKAVRFSPDKLEARFLAISELGCCQVCEKSYSLDIPHHVVQGIGLKDDRFLINICLDCHRLIHSVGYEAVKKTREECKAIAWNNHLSLEGLL